MKAWFLLLFPLLLCCAPDPAGQDSVPTLTGGVWIHRSDTTVVDTVFCACTTQTYYDFYDSLAFVTEGIYHRWDEAAWNGEHCSADSLTCDSVSIVLDNLHERWWSDTGTWERADSVLTLHSNTGRGVRIYGMALSADGDTLALAWADTVRAYQRR